MSHPASLTPRKSRAPPLKIKRRPSPQHDVQTLILDRRIFLALLCIRVINALTIRTFFQPDEYYQSLEPAWKLVFGYGETTWEWNEAIRGFLYPSLFAAIWWVLKAAGVEDANVLVTAPEAGFSDSRSRRRKYYRLFARRYATTGRIAWQGTCSIITSQSGRWLNFCMCLTVVVLFRDLCVELVCIDSNIFQFS